jgi:hypothetical protein
VDDMNESDPLTMLVEQARRIAPHHPELAASYVAAIREKARGMGPEELEKLLGDLPKPAEAPKG